jgi:hypothetical protein
VFGGGGITPDIKIAYTRKFTDLQAKLEREQIFGDVASKPTRRRRATIRDLPEVVAGRRRQ